MDNNTTNEPSVKKKYKVIAFITNIDNGEKQVWLSRLPRQDDDKQKVFKMNVRDIGDRPEQLKFGLLQPTTDEAKEFFTNRYKKTVDILDVNTMVAGAELEVIDFIKNIDLANRRIVMSEEEELWKGGNKTNIDIYQAIIFYTPLIFALLEPNTPEEKKTYESFILAARFAEFSKGIGSKSVGGKRNKSKKPKRRKSRSKRRKTLNKSRR
jgi:hypothetical protein